MSERQKPDQQPQGEGAKPEQVQPVEGAKPEQIPSGQQNSSSDSRSEKLELGGNQAADAKVLTTKAKRRKAKDKRNGSKSGDLPSCKTVEKLATKSSKEDPQSEWLNDLIKPSGDCGRKSVLCKVVGFLDDHKYVIGGAAVVGILTVLYLKKCDRGKGGLIKACPITGKIRK